MSAGSRPEATEFEASGLASPALVAEALAPRIGSRGRVLVDVRARVLRREPPPLARYVATARGRGERVELVLIPRRVRQPPVNPVAVASRGPV